MTPSLKVSRWLASRVERPPLTRVTSTVWPVWKSNTRTPGVAVSGSPSWFMVGAWSVRVNEASTRSGLIGVQFRPPPSVCRSPKSERFW